MSEDTSVNIGVACPHEADLAVRSMHGQRHHAEELLAEVAQVIASLGLRLAMDKTRMVGIDEGFDFLGFHIRPMRKRGTKQHFVYTIPSKKAVKTTARISAKTKRSTLHMDLDELMLGVNRSLRDGRTTSGTAFPSARSARSTTTPGVGSGPGCNASTGAGAALVQAGELIGSIPVSPTVDTRRTGLLQRPATGELSA
jgi:hypothetical protein